MIKMTRFILMGAAMLLMVSCGKDEQAPPPEPLAATELVQALKDHFAEASPEVKSSIDKAIKEFESKDFLGAYQALSEIEMNPDLKQESRVLVARAHLTLNDLIAKAAEEGDKKSREMLRRMQYTK